MILIRSIKASRTLSGANLKYSIDVPSGPHAFLILLLDSTSFISFMVIFVSTVGLGLVGGGVVLSLISI